MSCRICAKIRGEAPAWGGALYEDDLIYAGHGPAEEGDRDVYLGRLLVHPKRHVPGIADLHDSEALAIGLWTTRLGRALAAEHVYVFVLGHQVPHVHYHVIARHSGTPREFWGLRVLEWPGAPRGREKEVAELCARLRKFISR